MRHARTLHHAAMLLVLQLGVVFAMATTAQAQDEPKAKAAELPSADDVLDKFIAAIGGKKAVSDIESCRATLSLIAGTQSLMDFHTLWHRDGAFQIRYERNNMEYRAGSDASVAWIFDTVSKYKLLGDAGAARVEDQANTPTMLYTLKSRYDKMEVLGETTYYERPCYELLLTDHDGKTRTAMFDRETAFLLGMKWDEESMAGPIPNELVFEDWKEVGAVMMWHKLTMRRRGSQSLIYVSKIEFNSTTPADFELPAEVKELVAKTPKPEPQQPAPTPKPAETAPKS